MIRGIPRTLALCLGLMALWLSGCGEPVVENQVPENPAPLPDPSERIEG